MCNDLHLQAKAAIEEPALDDLCHTELHRFSQSPTSFKTTEEKTLKPKQNGARVFCHFFWKLCQRKHMETQTKRNLSGHGRGDCVLLILLAHLHSFTDKKYRIVWTAKNYKYSKLICRLSQCAPGLARWNPNKVGTWRIHRLLQLGPAVTHRFLNTSDINRYLWFTVI